MSLKDIAKMVGTSPSTVSRVLNDKSPTCASKELREKIWAAAQKTGYQPNENARALQKGANKEKEKRRLKICVLFSRYKELSSDPFFEELLGCIEAELYRQGVQMDQVVLGEENSNLSFEKVDGVIMLGRCSQPLLAQVQKKSRNLVGIWRNSMDFHVDEVICDGKKAAQMAVDYLISLGHEKIAYIGDCSFEDRYVGYCNTLIQHGIPMNYNLIKATNQTKDEGKRAIRELIDGRSDFTAVFCANDITAVGVMEELKEDRTKKRKPVSVISIDDIEDLCDLQPKLTTIHIPRQEMAHMAVQLIIDRIRRQHREYVKIEFPCRIVKRDSCFSLKGF